jgi:hypothetical protein
VFDEAQRLKMGFYLGYGELAVENQQTHHYNTSIIVDREARIVGKYRKIHLPGHADHRPKYPFQHLEKRYFDVGNLGFDMARLRWDRRDVHLQRSPMARNVPGDGLAGGRDGDAWLQHPDPCAVDAGVTII